MKTRLSLLLLMGLSSMGRGQSPLPPMGKLTSFDPLKLQIEHRDEHWVVLSDGQLLKDCGKREQEAYLIASLIRQLGLNQHGVIGVKESIMEYWLVSGRAPTVLPRGLRVVPINLDDIRLEQSQGFWVLREPTRVLFNFGHDEGEARQGMTVLKTYGFNRVGVVGQGVPLMLLFVAHPEGSGSRSVSRPQQATKKQDKGPVPGSSPLTSASFYPTPILAPIRASFPGQEPGELLERGRPSRLAPASTAQAVPEAAVLGASITRATFDYRQAQVRREKGSYVLSASGQVLANFGTSERHARLAHSLLLHYRLTEVHQIGTPEAGVRYYLSNGQAPRGLMVGVMGESMQPEQLSVRQVGDRCFVVEHGRLILDAGPKEENARELIQVIRRYGFDHLCHVGQNDREGMTLLVRGF